MPFGDDYAAGYDVFYRDKDYRRECDIVTTLASRDGGEIRSVLDLGCGTGGHAVELGRRGFEVTAVDVSAAMLEVARRKLDQNGLDVALEQADIRSLELERTFDLAIAMFAVIGYLTSNHDLATALGRIRRHLRPGGTLVFDCWFGPAVLGQQPRVAVHRYRTADGTTLLRIAEPRHDPLAQVVEVEYTVVEAAADRPPAMFHESHLMRYFFPHELRLLLAAAGFEHVELSPFGDPSREPGVDDWNLLVLAR